MNSEAERGDAGTYAVTFSNEKGTDTATVRVIVVGEWFRHESFFLHYRFEEVRLLSGRAVVWLPEGPRFETNLMLLWPFVLPVPRRGH